MSEAKVVTEELKRIETRASVAGAFPQVLHDLLAINRDNIFRPDARLTLEPDDTTFGSLALELDFLDRLASYFAPQHTTSIPASAFAHACGAVRSACSELQSIIWST